MRCASPWRNGGGVTRELVGVAGGRRRLDLAHLGGARWRQAARSRAFEGVQRWFAVLSGNGVSLQLPGAGHRLTAASAPLEFDGDAAVDCGLLDGPTQDLNLMVRRDRAGARMQRLAGPQQFVARAAKRWPCTPMPARPSCAMNSGRWTCRRRASPGGRCRRARKWKSRRLAPCGWRSSHGPEAVEQTAALPRCRRNAPQPYGLVEDAALVVDGAKLHWVGAERDLPPTLRDRCSEIHDAQGALITPGLIDCHTHLVYGGDRAEEFELRLNGASYEEIAQRGGGIASTVRATRQATRRGTAAAERGAVEGAAVRRRDDAGDQVGLRAGAGA